MATSAERVKEMQRSDPVAKEQWYAYCEAYGEGVRDPNKHDDNYNEGFISMYKSGERLDNKDNEFLIKMIKTGQKKSSSWKMVWEQYCANIPVDGKIAHDPAKHTLTTLEGFFDFIGRRAAFGGVHTPSVSSKRQRVDAGPGGAWVMPGVMGGIGGAGAYSGNAELVARVKQFQRQGEAQKLAWHSYCDQNAGGVYDPSRHDAHTLQRFLGSHEGGMNTGYGGMHPPTSPAGVVGSMSVAVSTMGARIKAYQRLGESQKMTWHNYCDTNLGGVRDPCRHDADTLQAFITSYGVP